MKVALLTASDFPYGGAAEALVRNITYGLSENNVNIEVVRLRGRRYNFSNDTNINCSNYLFSKPFKIELLKFFELFAIICYVPFFLFYRKFFKSDNIIILYGMEYSYLVIPFIVFSRIMKIRCFRIITDFYKSSTIVPVWWKNPKLFFYHMQMQKIDKYLDGVIVLTKYLYNKCISYGVSENKLLLIPHFIKISDSVDKKKLNTEPIIGFCGTISVENGIIDLLKAFTIVKLHYPESKLIMIGKITDSMKNKIDRLNINFNDILFTGYLNKEQVEKKLRECSILVNPRQKGEWAEAGFPTKLGEYFATKRPVVATKVGDLRDYFSDKKELVFAEPNNPYSLANSIIYLIENKNKAIQIGYDGYKWARKNLDYHENGKKLLKFLLNYNL